MRLSVATSDIDTRAADSQMHHKFFVSTKRVERIDEYLLTMIMNY